MADFSDAEIHVFARTEYDDKGHKFLGMFYPYIYPVSFFGETEEEVVLRMFEFKQTEIDHKLTRARRSGGKARK